MSPLTVIITIAAYFVLLLTISHFASRKSDNKTFFSGDRKTPWPMVAFATIGAMISGVTFISVPGMVVNNGYAYLHMILGFIVGFFLIAVVLIPIFYKRNLVSIYGYLEGRFGQSTYRTGAWFFFASKMLGAAVRFFVVCVVLQGLVCEPLHIPFELNVIVTIALIWLYTAQGGVKSIIWTDNLKSFCLIMSVILCIYFVSVNLGYSASETLSAIKNHSTSKLFFFDDVKSGSYFWKQFIAGIFMAIACNGLDQDLMQRSLACRDSKESQKNLMVSGVLMFFVIALFLVLGTLLVMFLERNQIDIPEKTDSIFSIVASHSSMPVIVGILFIVGLIAAAYSAAGSALTSLTTSFTVDILDGQRRYADDKLTKVRKRVHFAMSAIMGLVIVVFYYLSNQDAISAVYTLASYTYGPILGLFTFGLFFKHPVRDRFVPIVCVAAPALSWVIQDVLLRLFDYHTSFELLIINAAVTMIGLRLLAIGYHPADIAEKGEPQRG